MEKKLLNTILVKVSLISSILAVVVVILLSITVREYRNVSKNYQKILETTLSDTTKREQVHKTVDAAYPDYMTEREQVALKIGFRLGARAVAERTTSGCFHAYPPEVLQKVSRKNIVEFRFQDGMTGHLIFGPWKNP